MALLDAASREDISQKFVERWFVSLAQTAELGSDEVLQLVSDLDTWLDANAAAANNAISVAVRTKATTTTKYAALAYVALKRSGLI